MDNSEPPAWVTQAYPLQAKNIKQQRAINLYHWSQLETLNRRKYLVKGLFEQGSLSVVYGESNSGKTFFALDVAAHISLGWRWQARNTRKGKVVYIAAESGLGIVDRLKAFKKHYEIEHYGEMHLALRTVLLSGENNDTTQLIAKVKETEGVELIVIDTLARAMGGGNENNSDDMGFFIQCCDKIREETGAHVMVIHHSGKDSSKGARGHSSLRAAIDTEIQVIKENGIITAQIVKQRDGKNGDQFSFELKQIDIGLDEDGDTLTSCILLPCHQPHKTRLLSGQKRRALKILLHCLLEKGEVRTIRRDMAPIECVTLNEYRDYLKQERISSSDKPDSVSKAITRAIDELNNSGVTFSYGDYICITDKKDKQVQTEILNISRQTDKTSP